MQPLFPFCISLVFELSCCIRLLQSVKIITDPGCPAKPLWRTRLIQTCAHVSIQAHCLDTAFDRLFMFLSLWGLKAAVIFILTIDQNTLSSMKEVAHGRPFVWAWLKCCSLLISTQFPVATASRFHWKSSHKPTLYYTVHWLHNTKQQIQKS